MISYITGTLESVEEQYMIVETGGIGYLIYASPIVLAGLPPRGSIVKMHIHMNIKEDSISLFGFPSRKELDIFHRLISVSGVGPKGALGLLAVLTPEEIMMAIVSDDAKTLSKAPGIGIKIAKRMILELKDKLKTQEIFGKMAEITEGETEKAGAQPKLEAIEALLALGYSRSEAAKAVAEIFEEGISTENLLKQALKKMIR